jgi:polyvinyl alcohol dehydrogenase (cytochrome)
MVRFRLHCLAFCLAAAVIGAAPLRAQDGQVLYSKWCAVCHESTAESNAPPRDVLAKMSAQQILTVLEKGQMKTQAQDAMISRAERRTLAEFLSGKSLGNAPADPIPPSAFCRASTNSIANSLTGPVWNGWGVTVTNTRFQPPAAAGITAEELPRLNLKWAFGFPDATSASSQPVVAGGRVYIGSWEGDFYSLDAKTGCIRWTFPAESGVRSAASLGTGRDGRLTVYFGDLAANVYALDAATGKQLWKTKVDDYPASRVTGSPTLYDGKLYVPVSSREESRVEASNFPCCGFRGSVVALNAANGRQLWKTYTITKTAEPTRKNRAGTQLYGPSGVAVWVSPTLDVRRNALYIGTGNDYSSPSTSMSDSVIAMDMTTGKIRWVRQFQENDVWNRACGMKDRDPAFCPDEEAPDADFSASPILVQLQNGRQIVAVQGKSAVVYALDPDQQGKTIWERKIGRGGGAVWGQAVENETLYATAEPAGLVAVDLRSGTVKWAVPSPACPAEDRSCSPAQNAALTAIPGAVFAESVGGHIRAYSTRDGAILWDQPTARDYDAVNGVKANGGSISNGGATVVGGMLFINSGYSHHGARMPGNVLLAFGVDGGS